MKTNNENDIDPLAENLHLSSLEDGLERVLTEQRAPNPTTPEPLTPSGPQETEEQGKIRRNTMAAATEQKGVTSSHTTPEVNPEQMRQIFAAISGGTRKPKVKKPKVY